MKWPASLLLVGLFAMVIPSTVHADEPASIQLVGNFNGISCEPNDPANDMSAMGDHVWRKLKFVNEPSSPDTIYFKFTRDGSYLPMHWGWSGTWGVAEFAWSPPNIAAVLPDSGFYYFYFNDSDYTYWLERPGGSISGAVSADNTTGVPGGTCVTLFDSEHNVIGMFDSFTDDSYRFEALGAAVYAIAARAPGYRDTTITDILLDIDEAKDIPIHLTQQVGVLIASVDCRRRDGGVQITWCTMECGGLAAFDVYRGYEPALVTMERRNGAPVSSNRVYEFFDRCEDQTKDVFYYLVELSDDDPTRYGPLLVKGVPAAAGELGQNYPNPFNPSTTIPYTIGERGAGKAATMSFYNVAGRLVDRYDLGARQPGSYTFRWTPFAAEGASFPSGVYYCRLQIDKGIYTRKVILLR